jgi:UDP-N-acetylmuramoylalanine-D-glutamate ligase
MRKSKLETFETMELQRKKTLVLGAGKSGVAAAKFLAIRGAIVAIHDKKPIAEWTEEARSLKEKFGVGLIDGQIPSWLLDQIDLVVISPGVPTNTIPARYVDRKGGEVIASFQIFERQSYSNYRNEWQNNDYNVDWRAFKECWKESASCRKYRFTTN